MAQVVRSAWIGPGAPPERPAPGTVADSSRPSVEAGAGCTVAVSHPRGGTHMPSTGDIATVAGIYVSTDGCQERITMPQAHEFPPCPKCGGSTGYTLVTPTKQ